MNRLFNPAGIHEPIGAYSHGVESPPGSRFVHVSGQVGMASDGSVPSEIAQQTENAFRNLLAVLAEAGMAITDVVKINAYLTRVDDAPGFREARGRVLGEHRPAMTLVFVSALAKPEIRVEVEAVAAKA